LAKKEVYFDNAATTRLDPRALEKMLPYLDSRFGNPSSFHSFGRIVRVAVEEARETLADFINCAPNEIYFTSGGSESNNFSIFGIAKTEVSESGRKTIITTKAEHHCILDPVEELGKSGFSIKLLDVNTSGRPDENILKANLDNDTSLISIIHANNETGAVNDIKNLAQITHLNNSLFHSDAVQSFGKIPIDVNKLGIDSMSFSSHKIAGPKGTGAVFAKSGTPLSPLIYGGSQERNRRGGTENPAAIIGFAEAIKIVKIEMQSNYEIVKGIKDGFVKGIREIDPVGIELNTTENSLPYILSITLKHDYYNNDAESILMYLDINGIAASNGATCTSGTLKPSHVILSMGKPLKDAQGTIRFSFSAQNTLGEVEYVLEILKKMTRKFRKD